MRLRCLIGLGSEVCGSRSTLREKSGEHRLDEGTEDDLGATVRKSLVIRFSHGREWMLKHTRSEGEPSTRQERT